VSQTPSIRRSGKREQILRTASQLFIDRGFDAVSMDTIASEAGVSKQTVYSHFGCKEDLFAASIEAKCVEFNLGDALADLERPLEEALNDFALALVELLKTDDVIKLSRILMARAAESTELSEIAWQVSSRRTLTELQHYLEQQVARQKLVIDDCDLAARQFLSMINGLWHKKQLMGMTSEDELQNLPQYVASCVDLFLKGYAKS